MHQYIYQQKYVWKSGVILKKGNNKAEITEDYGKREIRIRVVGNKKRDFLTVVTYELDKINNSYKRLKYQKLIPCNCSECNNQQEPHFYRFDVLQKAKEKGQRAIQCQKSFEMVDVLKLIDDVIIPDNKLEIELKPANNTIKNIKIFLASSSELEKQRDEFELSIRQENDRLHKDGIYLNVIRWENFIDAMSATRLQDEYNKAVEDCDIFVSLFHSKVGKYTEEEFEKAFKTFKANDKPLIYTYFNQEKVEITPDIVSVINFQQKLRDLGHYWTKYDGIKDLLFQFNKQLKKVLPDL